MDLPCSSQAGVDCAHREHERQEHNLKVKLPGGADLALTVISVSEDLLWGWELVGLGAGRDFLFHKEVPRLLLLPSHFVGSCFFLLGLSSHTSSFYVNVLVVKIKS